jgi:Cft2 family RNA processing exonuclease
MTGFKTVTPNHKKRKSALLPCWRTSIYPPRFWNAGHILGSASIEIEISDEERPLRILFSGDLGPDNKFFQADPEAPSDFDYIVCESTYGGQTREFIST